MKRRSGVRFARAATITAFVLLSPAGCASLIPGTSAACMTALIDGELVVDARWGIALHDSTGFVRQVIWPNDFVIRPMARGAPSSTVLDRSSPTQATRCRSAAGSSRATGHGLPVATSPWSKAADAP